MFLRESLLLIYMSEYKQEEGNLLDKDIMFRKRPISVVVFFNDLKMEALFHLLVATQMNSHFF